jgi:hypothetical protein
MVGEITGNNMAINLTGGLPPEILGQQQQLNRQQQMAQMLMQQGQQMPQGQMISGRYVKPSIFASLAPLAQMYAGQKIAERGDKQALELASQLRQRYGDELREFRNLMQGREELAPEQAGPTQTGQAIPREMVRGAPNMQGAYDFAVNAYNPALQQLGLKKLTEGPEAFTLTEGAIRYERQPDGSIKQIAAGGQKPRAPLQIDTGTAIELRDPNNPTVVLQRIPKSLSPADTARMQFEGIIGGGMPMGNAPAGNMPMANAPASQDKFAPAVQPQYQYNPAISPKLNQEAAAKFSDDLAKNQRNAKDSFDLMKSASALLSSEAPSSGRLSNIVTGTREFFGGGGEASKADAQLNLLSGALTMKQPRFEGPQGVLDVTLYQKLAGDLGNPNLPVASRLATINQMIDLQKKYYPQGDWDSISTKTQGEAKAQAVKSAGKVSLGAPMYATNPTTGERIMSTDGGINWKPVGGK